MKAKDNGHKNLLSQEEKENITRKKVILIVDDSVEYLRIFTKMLESRYDLALAKSGKDAIHIMLRSPVDLVLLDIEMPGMSGLELLNITARNPVYSTVPVIFVTSHAQSDMITRASELGAKGYIVKPFQERALIDNILQVLSSSPGKMAAVDLTKRLINIENSLIKIQKMLTEASEPVDAVLDAQNLRAETLGAFKAILEENKYSSPVMAHLNRIFSLIKKEDEQALARLREFINNLGVRDLAVGSAS
jgi:CheY-like chemotaxis protein